MTQNPHPPGTVPDSTVKMQVDAFDVSEFARLLGMRVTEARDGYARVIMNGSEKKNAHGVAHGGAIFSLADHAFGVAANCGGIDRVAVSVHIQYLVPATGDLVAVANRVADNGKYSTYRVMVYDGERTVAAFDGVALMVSA
ncbi:PaaI family thioesterase [Methanoregula sp.]|uniref:PaaI family thioesterase n=1 Tax=Methanoregula sp. TaxID=2052170 RepID=UPI003C732246